MAWSTLVRGTILRRIRAQNLTLNRRGSSLRSLSSHSGQHHETSSSDTSTIKYVYEEGISDQAERTARFVQHALRCEQHTGIVFKCLEVVCHHPVFDTCSLDTKLQVLSTVFEQIQKYPQADPREVFLMKRYIKSMCTDDSKNDITKAEVMSRVLDVVQSYPKVGHYKVTEETRFCKDLRFDDLDFSMLLKALYLEFKLEITSLTVKVGSLIDHIYNRRMKRQDLETFRERNRVGDIFWPMPL